MMQNLAGAPPRALDAGPVIKDGSLKSFAVDVIQASATVPVLVDFWAPWCGPCKQLTPILEKVVTSYKGKVRLVKIDIDQNPELAQQLRIQSVPTVFAFVDGQPVTGFAGAQPESQIKALVDKLLAAMGPPAEVMADLDAAKALQAEGDIEGAAGVYGMLLEEEPENPDAIGGMARCLLSLGDLEEAEALLARAPAAHVNHVEITGAKAALALAKESGSLGDPADLQARLDADEDDHEARVKLATLLFLRGQVEPAMEHLLKVIKKDRAWDEDGARRQLVRFFEALGPKHPAVGKGRRMLSTVLFS